MKTRGFSVLAVSLCTESEPFGPLYYRLALNEKIRINFRVKVSLCAILRGWNWSNECNTQIDHITHALVLLRIHIFSNPKLKSSSWNWVLDDIQLWTPWSDLVGSTTWKYALHICVCICLNICKTIFWEWYIFHQEFHTCICANIW